MTAKINTYGLKMTGLLEAAAETRTLQNRLHLQISYDKADDRVHHTTHVDSNGFTAWQDPDMITVCYAASPLPAQEIADNIHFALNL